MDHPRKNEQERPQPPSKEFLAVMTHELALTAEMMGVELTELRVMAYSEALSDLIPERIQAGFKRARRLLQWFPKAIEVRNLSLDELEESAPKKYYLPEAEPVWTDEERAEFLAQLRTACGVKESPKPMTEEQVNARLEFLRKQRDQLLGGDKKLDGGEAKK